MNAYLLAMLLVGLAGFAATYCCIPLAKRVAQRRGLLSYPGGHSSHDRPVPLLGGAAMYASFALAFALYLSSLLFREIPPEPSLGQMLSLFAGVTWMMILGTIDDKVTLGWRRKLLGEFLGVAILLVGGHGLFSATLPFVGFVEFGWLGIPLFALVVLTITNAINLIDGIDGLAGGICFFAAMVTGIIGLAKNDLFSATLGFGISGGIVAFLRFNFPPASIFMGDGGSLTLGFLLGTLATSSAAPSAGQRSGIMLMLATPFLPFGIALLDVALAIFRRWVSGQQLFLPDTNHLHHRLMEKIGRPGTVVVILYAFSAALSLLTLSLVLGPGGEYTAAYVVLSSLLVFALLVMVLKLYVSEGLTTVLENRPHFQFLASFIAFMAKRARRSTSCDELVDLLGAGVRDLGFDAVRVYQEDQLLREWTSPRPVHPGARRLSESKHFGRLNIRVEWITPAHDSNSYQRYLKTAWNVFLKELESRLLELAGQDALFSCTAASIHQDGNDA